MESLRHAVSEIAFLFDEGKSQDDAVVLHFGHAEQARRVRAGDESAFEELILAFSSPLVGYARRFVANADIARDVVQDVFAHLWLQRETLRIRGSMRAYLYTAVRNRALDVRKSSQAELRRLTTSDVPGSAMGMGERIDAPDVALQRCEIEARVQAALDTLPARAREAALLRWRDGLSRGEIATIMGVAVATVNNQLTAAARVVRALLIDLRESA